MPKMSKITNLAYLKNNQYQNAANLDAQLSLHYRFSTNPHGWFPWVFDSLERLPRQARVLELGCGPAYMWSTCAQRISPEWSITLSDLSDDMCLAAWRNLVITGRAFKYEQIDAQSIPYPDETFDIVIANHVLHHVPDQLKALQEIRRVLKPRGHLVAATNGEKHLEELHTWVKQISLGKNYQPLRIAFTLENGRKQLSPLFMDIEIHRYEDNLRITEIEPLIAYIRSSLNTELSETELENLHQSLEIKLRSNPVLTVTKDAGLFLAIRQD